MKSAPASDSTMGSLPSCPLISSSSHVGITFPMTAAARAALQDFMAANPRGKHGRIVYDLKEDFGVDAEQLRERFDFYFDRFPVKVEA